MCIRDSFTCVSNDMSFDSVFSKYLEALGNRGDVLLAISTSGNSSNILQAIDTAHVKGMKVIGLTGKTGGEMKEKCDITIVVPWNKYSDRIQEIHIKIIHILIEYKMCISDREMSKTHLLSLLSPIFFVNCLSKTFALWVISIYR